MTGLATEHPHDDGSLALVEAALVELRTPAPTGAPCTRRELPSAPWS